ncbi:hypothetical protein ACFVFJ_48820 [Streptomyces sp. NPDC057717]|uniref:hypothetical protein n=1 Tax=Streptomyces sp. NPDC057717 TaxID=3346224 RepID=UPI0036BAFCBE
MILSGSAALILLLIVVFLIRRNNIKTHYAILCLLAGFYLAKTSTAPAIDHTLQNVADMFASIQI